MVGARRRLAVVLGLAVVPWTVVSARGVPTLFFPLGFATPDPLSITLIWEYYFRYTAGLPQYLLAFGIGVVLLGIALVSALSGVVWREDGRITAAMLVLAGSNNLVFALGFLRRPGYIAVPFGTVLCLGVVWILYRDSLVLARV